MRVYVLCLFFHFLSHSVIYNTTKVYSFTKSRKHTWAFVSFFAGKICDSKSITIEMKHGTVIYACICFGTLWCLLSNIYDRISQKYAFKRQLCTQTWAKEFPFRRAFLHIVVISSIIFSSVKSFLFTFMVPPSRAPYQRDPRTYPISIEMHCCCKNQFIWSGHPEFAPREKEPCDGKAV